VLRVFIPSVGGGKKSPGLLQMTAVAHSKSNTWEFLATVGATTYRQPISEETLHKLSEFLESLEKDQAGM
jgi:hypothetical protein